MHLEFGFDSRSTVTLILLGAAVAQTTVNRRVPGSNPGGGVGWTSVLPNYVLGGTPSSSSGLTFVGSMPTSSLWEIREATGNIFIHCPLMQ